MQFSDGYLVSEDRKIPWRNVLPEDWDLIPLKYLISINRKALPENTNPEFTFKYIDIGSVNSFGEIISTEELSFANAPSRARRVVFTGDVIISTVRTYLKAIAYCNQINEDTVCSTGFAVLSPKKGIVPKFLFYWVRSSNFIDEIVSRSTGVSYPAVNAAEIGSLPFPSLSEELQKRIASFLDTQTAQIDELIALKEKQIELLDIKRQSIISQAVTRGLDPNVTMKPSGLNWLSDIPAHWQLIKLKYLAQIKYGLGQPPRLSDEGLPLIRATNVSRGKILSKDLILVDPDDVPYDRDPVLHTNDVIVVRSGAYTGDSAIIPPEYDGSISGYDLVVRAIKANPEFLAYSLLSSTLLENQIALFRMRAAQPHLNAEDLGSCFVPLPQSEEQFRIVEHLDVELRRIDEIVTLIRRQIDSLLTYRQKLITCAVTGKIDLRGVDV